MQLKTAIDKKPKFLKVKIMSTKKYSKPQLIGIGDAIDVTLRRYWYGYYRDSYYWRSYWYRYYY